MTLEPPDDLGERLGRTFARFSCFRGVTTREEFLAELHRLGGIEVARLDDDTLEGAWQAFQRGRERRRP